MIILAIVIAVFIAFMILVHVLDDYSLNGIKAKTVGQGQHGTARWATEKEIKHTFSFQPYEPEKWRRG
ncbi:MAG: hypothetical protein IKN55_00215 [Oscillospiraceae bacterium]|nr:hypothetical protein [Oscillospiraceae bacterium]